MTLSLELIVILITLGFNLVFTFVLYISLRRMIRHYNTLTNGVEPKNLIKALEGIQKTLSEHERGNTITRKELAALETKVKTHLQTLTLKRFNPFGDTGGDQSFLLAILDGNKDGIVITSLHSRENTRFYVKSVKGGVGLEHPLSSDEQKIIKR